MGLALSALDIRNITERNISMLSVTEIKRFIEDDITSEKKRFAGIGQRYYEAKHDIMNSRLFFWNADGKLEEDKTRSNIKISHPFFMELAEQLPAYMLSFEKNPIQAKDTSTDLQKHLDMYFDDEFWVECGEIIKGAYVKGFDYMHAYKNAENRLTFQAADGIGIVEVREKDTDDGCKHIIYWYIDRIDKGHKEIKRIQVWSEDGIYYYVQVDNGDIIKDESEPINPRPHVVYTDSKTGLKMGYQFGYIPFFRLDNNKKQISGLKPIKGIIDDYDLHACSLSNNLKDFDTPLHVVTGFQGDDLDELQTNLKTKKIVGVDEGGVDVKTVDIPYEARKAKLELDEKNIYKFGMGLNTNGLKDSNATTNLAIETCYAMLRIKADNMQKRLNRMLKDICKVVLADINLLNKTDYQLSDIKFDFKRNTLNNESETIANEKVKADTQQVKVTTILNAAATIGDEQVLKLVCEQLDLDYEEIKKQLEKQQEELDLQVAQNALNNAVVDDNSQTPPQIEPIEE